MVEPRLESSHHRATPRTPAPPAGQATPSSSTPTVPKQYDQLLHELARAEEDLEAGISAGRSAHLEEASGIVFDLLYALDFRHGGELVPRLAALYGYIGNELLNVGRTGDRVQLAHLRDMITTLKQSWVEAA